MGFPYIFRGALDCRATKINDEMKIAAAEALAELARADVPDEVAMAYQGRKKCKTTNALFLTDRQGIPLAMSNPVGGNHHDLLLISVQDNIICNIFFTNRQLFFNHWVTTVFNFNIGTVIHHRTNIVV